MAAPTPDTSEIYVGLMSGTSVDGVDAVLADFSSGLPKILAHVYRVFDTDLRAELLHLCTSGADEIDRAGAASLRLADAYAGCVRSALDAASLAASDVRAIGAHGQTVRHRPDVGFTVQLNAPAHLAEATGIDVIADFRSRDLAAGGQGAPLVAAFHAAAFGADSPRAVVNIGGISNVTFLPAGTQPTLGFDCGPGNVLLDLNAARYLGTPMDRDGKWAEQGRADEALLSQLLSDPYFANPPPKSTGRELFSAAWLDAANRDSLAPADVQRTLIELTARAIGDAIDRWCVTAEEVVACGGGARNPVLMHALAAVIAPRALRVADELGIPSDQVEALAFAWLARCFVRREPGAAPAVTGARGGRVLGALYPA